HHHRLIRDARHVRPVGELVLGIGAGQLDLQQQHRQADRRGGIGLHRRQPRRPERALQQHLWRGPERLAVRPRRHRQHDGLFLRRCQQHAVRQPGGQHPAGQRHVHQPSHPGGQHRSGHPGQQQPRQRDDLLVCPRPQLHADQLHHGGR
ncbi:hypothetical protein OY671_012629, partial [Metschnikowia pulcherrima]